MTCPACKKEQINEISSCKNCSFPFNGTEKEKAIHIANFISKKGVLFDSNDSIEKSQQILYGISLVNLVFIGVDIFTSNFYIIDLIINLTITFVLAFCGFMIRKNPIKFTLIPLFLLISIYTLNAILDPYFLHRGILMKLVILGSLIYSIYLIKSADRFKKKYDIK